jgi:hypothetical protein
MDEVLLLIGTNDRSEFVRLAHQLGWAEKHKPYALRFRKHFGTQLEVTVSFMAEYLDYRERFGQNHVVIFQIRREGQRELGYVEMLAAHGGFAVQGRASLMDNRVGDLIDQLLSVVRRRLAAIHMLA